MWEYTYETTMDAPPEVVYGLIANLSDYQNWNPFIVQAEGTLGLGQVITGRASMGRFRLPYSHRIYEYIPGKSLCWRDFGPGAWFICGQRRRYVEVRGDKTHYTCHLQVTGLLAGLARLVVGIPLRNGIIAEAEAMKRQLESRDINPGHP